MVEKPPSIVDHYLEHLALLYEELLTKATHARCELRAAVFAVKAHGAQKYGDQPYAVHLHAVRQVLREYDLGGDIAAAAWLHDVLEDTDTTYEQLTAAFGPSITSLVWAVTGEGDSRSIRNEGVYQKIAYFPLAGPLKLADRIANVSACIEGNQDGLLSMYRREHLEFRSAVSKHCNPTMWKQLEDLLR